MYVHVHVKRKISVSLEFNGHKIVSTATHVICYTSTTTLQQCLKATKGVVTPILLPNMLGHSNQSVY